MTTHDEITQERRRRREKRRRKPGKPVKARHKGRGGKIRTLPVVAPTDREQERGSRGRGIP
jgi:hypothetical protein